MWRSLFLDHTTLGYQDVQGYLVPGNMPARVTCRIRDGHPLAFTIPQPHHSWLPRCPRIPGTRKYASEGDLTNKRRSSCGVHYSSTTPLLATKMSKDTCLQTLHCHPSLQPTVFQQSGCLILSDLVTYSSSTNNYILLQTKYC